MMPRSRARAGRWAPRAPGTRKQKRTSAAREPMATKKMARPFAARHLRAAPSRSDLGDHAASRLDILTGDPARLVAHEERHHVRDVVRPADPPQERHLRRLAAV